MKCRSRFVARVRVVSKTESEPRLGANQHPVVEFQQGLSQFSICRAPTKFDVVNRPRTTFLASGGSRLNGEPAQTDPPNHAQHVIVGRKDPRADQEAFLNFVRAGTKDSRSAFVSVVGRNRHHRKRHWRPPKARSVRLRGRAAGLWGRGLNDCICCDLRGGFDGGALPPAC